MNRNGAKRRERDDRGARAHLRVDGPALQTARAGACQVADAIRAQRCSRRRVGVAWACAMGDGIRDA